MTREKPNSPPAPFWPLYVIDFEASSLEDGSYPIEVGIAIWPARDAPVRGWSTLIQPYWEWRENGRWSRRAQQVHGIDQSMLASGMSVEQVARVLNKTLSPAKTVCCDGGDYDLYWMTRLFDAAGVEPSLQLRDWRSLLARFDPEVRDRALGWRGQNTLHRARADAEALLFALAHSIGAAPGRADWIIHRAASNPPG